MWPLSIAKPPVTILSTAWLTFLLRQSNGLMPQSSRAQFLSGAASFFTSSVVLVSGAEECSAKVSGESFGDNPRYIQQELEMKYGEGKDGNPRSRGVLVRRVSALFCQKIIFLFTFFILKI